MTPSPNEVFATLDMTIDVWWEPTCDDETDLVAVSLDTAGCQSTHQFRLTVDEAQELRRLLDEALLAIRIGRDPNATEMDEDLIALHAPAALDTAKAVAKWFDRTAYIFREENGDCCAPTFYVPECAIYLSVHPDGSTQVTDNR